MGYTVETSHIIHVDLPERSSDELFKFLWVNMWQESEWEVYGLPQNDLEYRMWEEFLDATDEDIENLDVLSPQARLDLIEIRLDVLYGEYEAPVTVWRYS